jgi:peptide chain release factor 2
MSDAKEAISVQQKISNLKTKLDTISGFEFTLNQCMEMKQLGVEEKDLELLAVVEQDSSDLKKDCYDYYLKTLMSQDIDKNGCFIELRSGAGGVEACDWVEMLTRMYERWGIDRGYQVKVVDFVRGDIAGYKTSTASIQGEYAFGWAKYETGIHRFVRCSPFDSQGKRHTSFVSVQVIPALGNGSDGDTSSKDDIEIPARDLKMEVMRSQGAGGQHVNKTESAVRMTHIPTGITAFVRHFA